MAYAMSMRAAEARVRRPPKAMKILPISEVCAQGDSRAVAVAAGASSEAMARLGLTRLGLARLGLALISAAERSISFTSSEATTFDAAGAGLAAVGVGCAMNVAGGALGAVVCIGAGVPSVVGLSSCARALATGSLRTGDELAVAAGPAFAASVALILLSSAFFAAACLAVLCP